MITQPELSGKPGQAPMEADRSRGCGGWSLLERCDDDVILYVSTSDAGLAIRGRSHVGGPTTINDPDHVDRSFRILDCGSGSQPKSGSPSFHPSMAWSTQPSTIP